MEIKKGRSEKEILEELGDPRLIAKTIIDTAGEEAGSYVEETSHRSSDKEFSNKVFRIPLWVGMILLLLIVIVVFKVVGLVLGALLPIIVPVALVYFLIRYFKRR